MIDFNDLPSTFFSNPFFESSSCRFPGVWSMRPTKLDRSKLPLDEDISISKGSRSSFTYSYECILTSSGLAAPAPHHNHLRMPLQEHQSQKVGLAEVAEQELLEDDKYDSDNNSYDDMNFDNGNACSDNENSFQSRRLTTSSTLCTPK